ncbi:MAG: UDP-3-O-(3-hydroxymyristoyl)glucosamine N-acyltransferase [Bacteroidota bacterium]
MPSIADLKKVVSPLRYAGGDAAAFNRIIQFDVNNTAADVLMWVGPAKNSQLSEVKAGTILCEETAELPVNDRINLVVVSNARAAFRQVLEAFYKRHSNPGIHPTAVIHSSIVLTADCSIGAYVVLDEGCTIGRRVSIGHHTVIGSGTVIGDDAIIGTHCSIGGDGFGYEKDEAGHYMQIPHIGHVFIKDHVDIGNNVCIDRGTLGATTIGSWSRIDNLVHIAHNVQIGTDTLVIAQAMIAGSCEIGNDVWIAPCAAILNKINVAEGARVGMGAIVFKNVNEGETVMGNPARVTKSS